MIIMSKSKGFGDTVKKVARYLGLDRLASEYEKATGKDCGCGERQSVLNKWFPYAVILILKSIWTENKPSPSPLTVIMTQNHEKYGK